MDAVVFSADISDLGSELSDNFLMAWRGGAEGLSSSGSLSAWLTFWLPKTLLSPHLRIVWWASLASSTVSPGGFKKSLSFSNFELSRKKLGRYSGVSVGSSSFGSDGSVSPSCHDFRVLGYCS